MIKQKRKKFTFLIKNIDVELVDRKYGIEIQSNLQMNKNGKNITKIDKLVLDSNKSYYSYIICFMIIKIDNTNFNISEEIYPVFQFYIDHKEKLRFSLYLYLHKTCNPCKSFD